MADSIFDKWNKLKNTVPQKGTWDAGTLFGTKLTGYALPDNTAAFVRFPQNEIGFNAETPYNEKTKQFDYAYGGTLQQPSTLAHEQEHIMQNRATQRYAPDTRSAGASFDWRIGQSIRDAFDLNNASPFTNDWIQKEQDFRGRFLKPEVISRLEELGLKSGYLKGLKKGNSVPLDEIFADLSGLEDTNRIDITKDPVLSKALFNNDIRWKEVYKANTGLRQDRLDAKDLPPNTPQVPRQPTEMESLKNLLFGTGFDPSIK